MIDLLLATNNAGKIAELRNMLPDDVVVSSLRDLNLDAPEETGASFAENSASKAISAARSSGLLALGDDSGLEVGTLNGLPGIRSKRYAGEDASDRENIELLLGQLAAVPANQRSASFVCVLTLANSGGVLASASGRCEGRIGTDRRGQNGFGYDPVFYLKDGRTIAELSLDEKDEVSHRSIALRSILPAVLIAVAAYRFHTQGVGQ